ncbi:MAG TPA: molybdopterin-binding protein, partial [Acetobacteraceae bacterium]|nr:molybdopterin-binding protein [Acetobacteraceae bacterium]
MPKLDETKPFKPVNIAVLTVSDTRTAANDTSGDALAERIEAAGHTLIDRTILRDDIDIIAAKLTEWIANP